MPDHSGDVHQSLEKVFQKDTLKEFELIDPSFLDNVDDIINELGILEKDKPIASPSLTLTQPETGKIFPRPILPDLSTLEKLLELLPTATACTTESTMSSPVESVLMPMTHMATIQKYPFSEDFNSLALASYLHLLETKEQPT
ncbi:hypothetical protein PoB_004963300 [Plakobranchus ocellatus]|uniref:Uncharacterized protein n=1 Tax=Plakobranchus ocellatus TaxID=259542 RepID=A0AAV4BWD7_9GAST|nr:hypothetical protein PoB_004963300 [Plakobranchus ocellatus]